LAWIKKDGVWVGLSSEVKPVAVNGEYGYEIDTDIVYLYTAAWAAVAVTVDNWATINNVRKIGQKVTMPKVSSSALSGVIERTTVVDFKNLNLPIRVFLDDRSEETLKIVNAVEGSVVITYNPKDIVVINDSNYSVTIIPDVQHPSLGVTIAANSRDLLTWNSFDYTVLARSTDPVNFDLVSQSGLTLVFSEGKLVGRNGSDFKFDGGVISVPDNAISHIYVDLNTKLLHALELNCHQGGVFLGRAVATNGAVTFTKANPIALPVSYIERFKEKLLSTGKVKVCVIGNSLSVQPWVDWLFNATYADIGFNVPNVASVSEYKNYAVGGQSARHSLMTVSKPIHGYGHDTAANTSFVIDGTYFRRYAPVQSRKFSDHWVKSRGFDLAIISCGTNAGTDQLMYMETCIKELREAGMEVVIWTETPKTTNLNPIPTALEYLQRFAVTYGCALVDTFSYIKEAFLNGESIFLDTTHPNEAGNAVYAAAFRSVLNDILLVPGSINSIKGRVYKPKTINVPYGEIQVSPNKTTGTWVPGFFPTTMYPGRMFAGLPVEGCILKLEAGQMAKYAHTYFGSVDVICDLSEDFNVTVTDIAGTTIATLTNSAVSNERIGLKEVWNPVLEDKGDLKNTQLTFTVNSGTFKVCGVIFHTPKTEHIWWDKFTTKPGATTGFDTGKSSASSTFYVDAKDDFVNIDFEGIGCQVILANCTTAAIVDIYLDGELIEADFDLYTEGNYLKAFNIFVDEATDFEEEDRKHTLRIYYKNTNASVSAPTITSHRVQVYSFVAFKRN
jgi:hypothetical protein